MWIFRLPVFRFVFFLLVTLLSTTMAGAEWVTGRYWLGTDNNLGGQNLIDGLWFSLPFLGILTCHEFGHYFTAKFYRASVTLPFYIPLWLGFLGMPSIGTLGAFIGIRSQLRSRKEYFDVGIAGPLAGFVVAMVVLWYGFTHLPGLDFIFNIHPEYLEYGAAWREHIEDMPGMKIQLGKNLLFWFMENYVVVDTELYPHPYELMHYPLLLAGYLACFFTSLNLLPMGQLDGGHLIYGLFGQRGHNIISPVMLIVFVFYAGLGAPNAIDISGYDNLLYEKMLGNIVHFAILYLSLSKIFKDVWSNVALAVSIFGLQYGLAVYLPQWEGYSGWTFFGLLIGRFLGVYHPPAYDETPLNWKRKLLGWFTLGIFIICFSPKPLQIEFKEPENMPGSEQKYPQAEIWKAPLKQKMQA
jgi:hypothetical protein